MERWFLDTNVLIDVVRDRPPATHLLASLPEDAELWSVTVVRAELIAGARAGDGPFIDAVLRDMHWLDIDPLLADLAGRMAAFYRASHPGIDIVDYLIAAGARLLDASLLTLNVKHFPMFPDVEPAYL